jgi:hypothetical protein
MKFITLFFTLAFATLDAVAQAPPAEVISGINPQIDPFAANARLVPPPPSPVTLSAVPLPAPLQAPLPSLPTGLRAILIRDNGQGLLGRSDASAFSIPVAHGKTVRIGDHDYHAEVTATEIRLYSGAKGKLLWEGTLGGPEQVSAPVDLSQVRFIPPLSAGVSPGLKSSTSSAKAATPIISKISESQ